MKLRTLFVATTLVAVVTSVFWPAYKSWAETIVVESGRHTTGTELGWVSSPTLIQTNGSPGFIFNTARTIHQNSNSLPYVIALPLRCSDFQSYVSPGDPYLFSRSRFSLDGLSVATEYQVDATPTDRLAINKTTIDLTKGRLICVRLKNGQLKISQHHTDCPEELFTSRPECVLRWWRTNRPQANQ